MSPDHIRKHPSANRRRVFLFLVFLVPSILCLGFYYFVIREPLKNGTKIYKALPHFGPAGVKSNGDSLFFLIRNIQLKDARGQITDHLKAGHERAIVFLPQSEEGAKPFLAQLFRIQDKLHYLRRQFQINSITEEPCHTDQLKQWILSAHADKEIWTEACLLTPFPRMHFSDEQINTFLIDRHGAIRGIYDLQQLKEADRFIAEVIVLAAEFGKLKKMKTHE